MPSHRAHWFVGAMPPKRDHVVILFPRKPTSNADIYWQARPARARINRKDQSRINPMELT
jgi:hypothetical protein